MVVGLRGGLCSEGLAGGEHKALSHTHAHTHAHVHAPGTTLRHFVILGLCQWGGLLMSLRVQTPGEASPQHMSTDTCAHTCTEIHRHTCAQTCTDTRTETQRPRDAHVCTCTDAHTRTHTRPAPGSHFQGGGDWSLWASEQILSPTAQLAPTCRLSPCSKVFSREPASLPILPPCVAIFI